MSIWKSILLFIIGALVMFFLGAVSHEYDIYRSLKETGKSGYAGWFYDFTSSEMKDSK